MGANNSTEKHLDQDYNEIKKKWIGNQKKFEDDKFPALNRVLASKHEFSSDIKWLRPHEICDNPEMIVDGTNRFDVKQGEIGNCWFQGMYFILYLSPIFISISICYSCCCQTG